MYTNVYVTAEQASLIYRDLRAVEGIRRRDVDGSTPCDADVTLHAAILLMESRTATGGTLSGDLVALLVGLLREADTLALHCLLGGAAREVARVRAELRSRREIAALFQDSVRPQSALPEPPASAACLIPSPRSSVENLV